MGELKLLIEVLWFTMVSIACSIQVRVERKVCVHEVKKTEVSKEKKW